MAVEQLPAWRYFDGTNQYINYAKLTGGTWAIKNLSSLQVASLLNVLGRPPGAAQVAWVSTTATQSLQIVTQTAFGTFGAPQAIPHVADVYALDAAGNLLGHQQGPQRPRLPGGCLDDVLYRQRHDQGDDGDRPGRRQRQRLPRRLERRRRRPPG